LGTITALQIRLATLTKTRSAPVKTYNAILRQIDQIDKKQWRAIEWQPG
jgi:hypothetical protein